ncbi:ABC transporter A family member 2-like [Magnolia sinica]|uniref:ABC transporter A family member 2-like n=1 Tax=Magnolia sinica TaxID=86752 RepID=UPI0026585370|nr:ABC transporter A family member 2-like [Magnolia sinica]
MRSKKLVGCKRSQEEHLSQLHWTAIEILPFPISKFILNRVIQLNILQSDYYLFKRSDLRDPNFNWIVGLKEFTHPATQTFSVVGTIGPTFFLAIAMLGFVFQVGSLITEKELKLRQAMSIMGLYESAYWLSWLTWETFPTLLSSLFSILFGMMFQFDFFLHNSFVILFLVFFLFQFNMIGFAFMISTFISKSSSATTVGFCLYHRLFDSVTGFGFPYDNNFSKTYRVIWSFFPPNLFLQNSARDCSVLVKVVN